MNDSEDLLNEKAWVTNQLGVADINIRYHEDFDSRAMMTIEQWRGYRRELRDYIKGDKINRERPSIHKL